MQSTHHRLSNESKPKSDWGSLAAFTSALLNGPLPSSAKTGGVYAGAANHVVEVLPIFLG